MLALADYANDQGEAFPGINSLAQKTRLTRRQVQRVLHDLEASGEVLIERGTGRGHTHVFTIRLPGLRATSVHPLEPERVTFATQRVTFATRKGDTGVTRTVIEPSEEPVVVAEVPETAAAPRAKGVKTSPIAKPPKTLAPFDAVLRDFPGYAPTAAFFGKVAQYQTLDLEEEAIKMAGWLRAKRKRQCSTAFVLNWLKRASQAPTPPRSPRDIPDPASYTRHHAAQYHERLQDAVEERLAALRACGENPSWRQVQTQIADEWKVAQRNGH